MGGSEEMAEFKTIVSGSLIGTTKTDVETNGLTEFYAICRGMQIDNENTSTSETMDISINDTACRLSESFRNHVWGFFWYWHCVKIGNYWFCEKTATSNGSNASSTTNYAIYTNPVPIQTDVCNKISFVFSGSSNISGGSYEIIGR